MDGMGCESGGGAERRAVIPQEIYHVCASNLSVSAEMSLLIASVLGSAAVFKLPSAGLPEFEVMAGKVRDSLGLAITLLRDHDVQRMRGADAVVVYGSDETIQKFRQELGWKPRFLGYGQKLSVGLLWGGGKAPDQVKRMVRDVVTYEQAGCLSPQAYLCPDLEQAECWAEALAGALAEEELRHPSPARSFEEEGLIFEARQRMLLRGNRVWGTGSGQPWTVVLARDGFLEMGPGHRFIQVIPGSDWMKILQPWKGKLSTLALEPMERLEEFTKGAASLGFSRICPLGAMQFPVLGWCHDGRPRLADLLTWMTVESGS
ncbi:MAG: hypothetical protein HC904_13950 [Blastochloris sp.]|nr:hypothetical protein [Blastochloris sp.]